MRTHKQAAAWERDCRFHEAGHAVVHYLCGDFIQQIYSGIDDGYVKVTTRVDSRNHPMRPKEYMMGTMAGHVASCMFRGQNVSWRKWYESELRSVGSVCDSDQIMQIMEVECPDGDQRKAINQLAADTKSLLAKHWDLVELVAAKLETQNTITAKEFYAMVVPVVQVMIVS